MKRGPKSANAGVNGLEEELVKSTYKIPRTLKMNLQVVAMMEGVDQADLVREALDDFLRNKKDIDPTIQPRLLPHRISGESSHEAATR